MHVVSAETNNFASTGVNLQQTLPQCEQSSDWKVWHGKKSQNLLIQKYILLQNELVAAEG